MPIAQKLLAVMNETGYVQKSSKNVEQHYNFASEGAFIKHVRPAMLKAGVVCYPVAIDQQIGRTPSEKQVLVQGAATFRFQDAEDGTFVDLVVPFSGADSTDKAAYKAMTGARKYALRQALLVETGDDPEKDDGPEPANAMPPAKTAAVKATAEKVATAASEAKAPYEAWQQHGKVLVKDITSVESAAYAGQLDALGLTNAEACKLIGVASMKADRADRTLNDVVNEVAQALIAQNQRADSPLADRAKKLLKENAA